MPIEEAFTVNKEQLHKYVSGSTGNESNICQIYVIKDGETAYDDCWHGFKTEDSMNVNSVTKGVMALLAGIALDMGCIKSVDQKVMDFFPDYTVKRGEKTIYDVTIRHLLTMTAPYKGKSEPWKKVCTSQDWTLAILDHLVKRILHGDSSKEDQFDFFMNRNPRKPEWYSDPQGSVTAGWGMCASAYDLARLGQLVLEDGEYNGKRIVSQKYLDEMLTPYLKLDERFGSMNYGYLWYKPFDDRKVYAAIGDSGNIIYVNRELNVSVGITGTFKPRIFDRIEFIEEKVLPVF